MCLTMLIVQIVCYMFAPALALWLAKRERFGWLDPVLACYAVGMVLANLPVEIDERAANLCTEITIPLAIPMLLLRTQFSAFLKQSKQALVAFASAILTVFVSGLLMGHLFADRIEHHEHVAAMMTATLTGGAPNLASVGKALETPHDLFLLTNAADVVTGAVYLLFLLTGAKPLLAKFLPAPKGPLPMTLGEERDERAVTDRLKEGAIAVALAIAVAAASALFALGVTGTLHLPTILLGLTSGGIALSFIKRVRAMRESFAVGNYLILSFCVGVGTLTDLSVLLDSGGEVVGLAAAITITAVISHYLICAVCRIDVDTAIIASTAATMGPPLVIPVAKRLDNQQAFLAGMTSGLIGYAVGNYLGLAVAALLASG